MHTIRLRGPWQVGPIGRFVRGEDGPYRVETDELPAGSRMTMPADWTDVCGCEFFGRVQYNRIFQKPTGLDSGERVFLVVEPPISLGKVALNHKRLGNAVRGQPPLRADITSLLQDHNDLEIIVEHPALDENFEATDDSDSTAVGGLVGEVRLEIEE